MDSAIIAHVIYFRVLNSDVLRELFFTVTIFKAVK
jgi:hypothetical protein